MFCETDQTAEWSDGRRYSGDDRRQQSGPEGGGRARQNPHRRHPVPAGRLSRLGQDHLPDGSVPFRRDGCPRRHRQHGRLHRIHRQIFLQGSLKFLHLFIPDFYWLFIYSFDFNFICLRFIYLILFFQIYWNLINLLHFFFHLLYLTFY